MNCWIKTSYTKDLSLLYDNIKCFYNLFYKLSILWKVITIFAL